MAAVIIGGMLSSTVLSLLVVPCMYTYFDDLQSLILRIWHWRPFRHARRSRRRRPRRRTPRPAVKPRPRLEEVGSRVLTLAPHPSSLLWSRAWKERSS